MTASPPEAQVRRRRATIHPLRVAAVEPLTGDAVAIDFEVPSELADEYDFVQGQHISLRCLDAGDDVRRSYSVCTAAGSGKLRVAVKCLPGGVFSAYARDRLRPGDILEVVTPTGHFNTPLDASRSRRYAMIAAGSGIVPVVSVLATVLEREPLSSAALICGNRTVADIMFLEELEDLKNRYVDRFALFHVLSREEQEVGLFHGRIDADRLAVFLDRLVPPSDVDEWFLCGPRGLIDTARVELARRGVEPAHIHAELFHTESVELARGREASGANRGLDAATDGTAAAEVTIVLDGRRSSFTMGRHGERVLDAALRVRSDAPYACKGGVCGTCRARLVEGSVDMEQCFALEQSEIDDGFVLACQSHPASDRVVLDFDD